MIVKQVVEITPETLYCGWKGLEVKDALGNEVNIQMTDQQWLDLADKLQEKAKRVRRSIIEQMTKAEAAETE